MNKRKLGSSGIEVSPMGFGCWAIGGAHERQHLDGTISQMGWGDVDDAESIKAIHAAIDNGITLFDTANNYGAGRSETVLGQALVGKRQDVIIATKFGSVFDAKTRRHIDIDDEEVPMDEAFIRDAVEGSLRRLQTDYIDLYQCHRGSYDPEKADEVMAVLEDLVSEGKIRYYGWSTDHPDRARLFGQGEHGVAVQGRLNVLVDAPELITLCDELDMAFLNKSPLNAGILSGKYNPDSTFPENDGRHGVDFKQERIVAMFDRLTQLREILTADGRTMVQGALAWIWGRSERTLPIPGFKTVAQAVENAGAMQFGALTPAQMTQIDEILGRDE